MEKRLKIVFRPYRIVYLDVNRNIIMQCVFRCCQIETTKGDRLILLEHKI